MLGGSPVPYSNVKTKVLTPVENEVRRQVGRRMEIVEADSVDGRWRFELDETLPRNTRWRAVYHPTGQDMFFASLHGAREWAANPLSLGTFRDAARRLINAAGRLPGFGPTTVAGELHRVDRLNRARCVLAILDGNMTPAGGQEPAAGCECGGMLTTEPGGWVHVDACSACWTPYRVPLTCDVPVPRSGWMLPCRDLRHQHRVCADPTPRTCDHPGCVTPEDLHNPPCTVGHPVCCGCCHGED